ncbi:MAG: alanine--tRNA ligase, partial [Bacteroidales bacterium]|nr:alanine--tRNA ligase [Bacteroidales bacterium]
AKQENLSEILGKEAFVLFDTFGFPLDLTDLIARENGLTVDEAGFKVEMEAQKNRSRNAAAQETDDWVEIRKIEQTEFLGYDKLEAEIRIARYRKVTQQKKIFYQLVFDQTPFYGESGGQMGDSGYLEFDGQKTIIFDTHKENNLIVHLTEKLPANIDESFTAFVNIEKRLSTANNHTATHLLHAALRQVLGTHVEQKGSLVNADHLRFDFSHFQKMSEEEIEKVEKIVNAKIRENSAREENRYMPIDEAKQLGAMMLFGEKYGEAVRVIKFGESVELCGGTHVSATGQIGLFKIISEGAIAAGVRRIEAITAARAEKYVNDQIKTLNSVRETIKGSKDILESVAALLRQNSALSKQLESFQRDSLKIIKANLKSKVMIDKGVNIISGIVEVEDAAMLKDLAFQLKCEVENLYLVLGTEANG